MIKTRERESTQGEREHPQNIPRGRMLCRNFEEERALDRQTGRAETKNILAAQYLHPLVRPFVCTFQIACSIIRASRRANAKRTTREWVEDGLCDEPDFDSWAHPRSRKGRTAWHSDAFALGLIGHGIRANKHRAGGRLGVGMHAVSNGSRGAQ